MPYNIYELITKCVIHFHCQRYHIFKNYLHSSRSKTFLLNVVLCTYACCCSFVDLTHVNQNIAINLFSCKPYVSVIF